MTILNQGVKGLLLILHRSHMNPKWTNRHKFKAFAFPVGGGTTVFALT